MEELPRGGFNTWKGILENGIRNLESRISIKEEKEDNIAQTTKIGRGSNLRIIYVYTLAIRE